MNKLELFYDKAKGSFSDNSPNVLKVVATPKGHYSPVESLHLFLIHVVSNYLFLRLNSEISNT